MLWKKYAHWIGKICNCYLWLISKKIMWELAKKHFQEQNFLSKTREFAALFDHQSIFPSRELSMKLVITILIWGFAWVFLLPFIPGNDYTVRPQSINMFVTLSYKTRQNNFAGIAISFSIGDIQKSCMQKPKRGGVGKPVNKTTCQW